MRYKLAIVLFTIPFIMMAQNVGINNSGVNPNVSAMLDVSSSNKGILVPRIALSSATDVTTIPNPAISLLIYNTVTAGTPPTDVNPGFYYWNGSKWLGLITDNNASNNTAFNVSGGNLNIIDGGGTLSVPISLLGADNWGAQAVVTGVGLTGNGTTGSPLINNFTEVDGSVTNELQTISLTGTTATLSNSGGSFSINDADNNVGNEYNTSFAVSGGNLNILDGGGTKSVSLAAINGNDWHTNGNAATASSFIGTTNTQPFIIKVSNSEKMRVLANGNVGIGSSVVPYKLSVFDNSNPVEMYIRGRGMSGDPYDCAIIFDDFGASGNGYNGQGIFMLADYGSTKSEWFAGKPSSVGYSWSANFGDSYVISRKGLASTGHDPTAANPGNILFRINSSGNVGIGTSNPSFKLHIGTNSAAKPTSNTWTVASDKRLKKDIRSYESGLEDVLKINPVWFTYTGEAGMPKETGVGVVAQDLQKIAPYMIHEWIYEQADKELDVENETYLGVDNGAMTYMLINAVKDLNKLNNNLQQQLQQQQSQIEELKKLLEQK